MHAQRNQSLCIAHLARKAPIVSTKHSSAVHFLGRFHSSCTTAIYLVDFGKGDYFWPGS